MSKNLSSRNLLFSFLAATSSLATATPAIAQEVPRSPIVVTGRGLEDTPATPAYSVHDLDREQIETSASGRIEDVLSSVAGFQQFRRSDSRSSNPSAQGVTLRALGGNATSRALVLLDGVPMAHPFFGYIPLSAITPERLSSVRVTRGGGSGAFGSGAVAGTIELHSANSDALGLFNGSALINDRGETELSAIVAPELGSGYAVASVRWDKGKGFQTTPWSDRVSATARAAYDSWSANLRTVMPLNETVEMQVNGLIFEDDRTLRFQGANSSSSGKDASIRLVGRGEWQFDALAYVQDRDFSNVVIHSSRFVPVLDQHDTPSTGLGGKIELRPPVGEDHVLRIGSDLRISDGRMEEDPYNAFTGALRSMRKAGGRNSDLGFFVEDDWSIGPVVLTAGARADRWTVRDGYYLEVDPDGAVLRDDHFANRAGWDASFRGGAVWKMDNGVSLRAAAYSGLRLPTLNELYRGFVVFPVETRANAELKNERLEGFEAGIDFSPSENLTVSVTAFDNKVKNAIANVTMSEDGNTRERRNVDAIHAQGLEFGLGFRHGTVSFDGTLAISDAEVEASGISAPLNGMRPSQVPRIAASGTLSWKPYDGWRFAVTLRHIGKQYEDDLQTDVLKAATTVDAYAEMPLGPKFALVLRGENLTDETIVTRNQSGSIDLGTPATVWAGVKVRIGR